MTTGDGNAQAKQCTGELRFEYIPCLNKTSTTKEYVMYPLKFLHPSTMVLPGYSTEVVCILGYGGGLVGGDCTTIHVQVDENATVLLCTQATTKVYKVKPTQPGHTIQEMYMNLEENSTVAHLPDPVTCFNKAKFKQNQRFQLHETSNLLFVDWMTSGRHARGESWSFDLYDSYNQIYVGDKPVLIDRTRLQDEIHNNIPNRMGTMTVIGIIVLIGPKFQQIAKSILAQGSRKLLRPHDKPVPHGQVTTSSHSRVRSAISPLNDGIIIRLAAETTESAYSFVKETLQPIENLLGFTCFGENR